MPRTDFSLAEARRIALAAQGFDRPRPAGRVDARHLRRTIRRLGLLQIDSVNVLERAHYMPLFSRLGPYLKSRLDDLVNGHGEYTEHWAHVASIVPMDCWPLLRHRMEMQTPRRTRIEGMLKRHRGYGEGLLEQFRTRGPLKASDLPEPDGGRKATRGWWGWSTAKAAVEYYFARGILAAARRRTSDFARVYDLAERVIPAEFYDARVSREDAQRELMRRAARAHGIGTDDDLADYYRMQIGEARKRIGELVDGGELREVRVEGWSRPAYLHPEARLPRAIKARALLSPFDPVVWHRPRAERLFGFSYRIEIYVPAPKRQWGYYVLPFLLGERFAARIDLKADRAGSRLLVQAAHAEPDADKNETADALATELHAMADWLGLEQIAVGRRGNLARTLAQALDQ